MPASKDMYIKNYIQYKNESAEALEVFKNDIEKRDVLLFQEAIKETNAIDDPQTPEDIETVINHKMEKEGLGAGGVWAD